MSRHFHLLILLLCTATPLHAELYRWVDEHGKVHYTDKIPAQHQHRGHAELNEQGIVVDRVSASLTPAEKQHLIEQKRLQALRDEFDKKRQARDQALLDRYISADDLIMTRDGKVARVERSIDNLRYKADNARELRAKREQQIATLQAEGKPVPVDIIQKFLRLRQNIKKLDADIASEEVKKQVLLDQYTAELQRYRHLKQPDKYPAPVESASEPSHPDGVVACSSSQACAPLWKRAIAYLKQHAETPVKYQTDEIIMTDQAEHDKQVTLVLSLIAETEADKHLIFLDPHCRQTARGRNYCASDKVKYLMRQFRPAVIPETAPGPGSSSNPPARP